MRISKNDRNLFPAFATAGFAALAAPQAFAGLVVYTNNGNATQVVDVTNAPYAQLFKSTYAVDPSEGDVSLIAGTLSGTGRLDAVLLTKDVFDSCWPDYSTCVDNSLALR